VVLEAMVMAGLVGLEAVVVWVLEATEGVNWGTAAAATVALAVVGWGTMVVAGLTVTAAGVWVALGEVAMVVLAV
jgi:hypothetical protein